MNIFDMILKNEESREVLFSSIFNYLVDPNETHGLKTLFLHQILKYIPKEAFQPKLCEESNIEDSSITVTPERRLNIEGEWVGNVDSHIECKIEIDGDPLSFIIATEVKILDASSNNVDKKKREQLDRYYEALEEEKTDFYLIYLIPSIESKQSIRHFRELIKKVEETTTNANNIFIMFWKNPIETINGVPKRYVINISVEQMIADILCEETIGAINPISTEIKYVLKSLSITIKNDFNRDVIEKQRFPDRVEFLDAIGNQRKIFECIEAVNKQFVAGNLRVKSSNTSIGIPYKEQAKGQNNTLFRILTCKNYYIAKTEKGDNKVTELIIELNKEIYQNKIGSIVRTLGSLCEKHEETDNNGNPLYHPNGKNDEEVILLKFKSEIGPEEEEKIEEKINIFFKATRNVWRQLCK